ncbi:MAG: aminomethyl-transferring glycine dehydrogenase subunit GcvPA [Lachnospiraceae bacterium]|nr:aminomethyl-transferring glycine dehydrogenase subunit GcvPA [Lachnospiraceae bacterium]
MGSYVPITEKERAEMLARIGVPSAEALYADVPAGLLFPPLSGLPEGLSEMEAWERVSALAEKNRVYRTVLRGAGSYRHYIPAAVKAAAGREEFVTAYTPYQPEISQGLLQGMFEFQTMICELTGMDVANASHYDGATAAAETPAMCRDRRRRRVLVSGAADPQVLETMRTYAWGSDTPLETVPLKDGRTDPEALSRMLNGETAMVYLQQPNYFGLIEDAAAIGAIVHATGAKFVMGVNPIACALLPTPALCGADVAVGEGQPLGLETAFGGPYLGFMAVPKRLTRQLPGRIVGQTCDAEGRRGYVLTLSGREQHIRREKASSNICSNQAHCALTAAVYLSAMGSEGLRRAARNSMSKAHYLAAQLEEKLGWKRVHGSEFFHEFVTECPDTARALGALEAAGILGGLPVEGGLLWCVTELVSKECLDEAVACLREVF